MNHVSKFEAILKTMKVPENRKKGNEPNALWFIREGCALNKDHPQVLTAIFHAQRI